MKTVLMILFAICSLTHLYACLFGMNGVRKYTKPLIMLTLIMLYCASAHTVNIFVLLAMAFSLIGDIFLLYSGTGGFFTVGAGAFAAGHICYILGILTATPVASIGFAQAYQGAAVWGGIFLIALAAVYLKAFPVLPGSKKLLTPIYLLLICIFGTIAGTGLTYIGNKGFAPMFVGSLLFFSSDSILIFRTFGKPRPRSNVYVMLTYIFAQALIALGFITI